MNLQIQISLAVALATAMLFFGLRRKFSSELVSKPCVVFVTVPTREVGRTIANALVVEQLAACTNIIGGIESVYMWEGKINQDAEELLVIKSQQHLFPSLSNRIKSLHPYSVPEIISLPIENGSEDYINWIVSNTLKKL